MFFVTQSVEVSKNKYTERNVRIGGYRSIISASRSAVRVGSCYIRDEQRKIVGQTISPDLPMWVTA